MECAGVVVDLGGHSCLDKQARVVKTLISGRIDLPFNQIVEPIELKKFYDLPTPRSWPPRLAWQAFFTKSTPNRLSHNVSCGCSRRATARHRKT